MFIWIYVFIHIYICISILCIQCSHKRRQRCSRSDNPSALRRWMVAVPEVARLIEEFKVSNQNWSQDTKHHDQSSNVPTAFLEDVQSLIKVKTLGIHLKRIVKICWYSTTNWIALTRAAENLFCVYNVEGGTDAVRQFHQRMPGGNNETHKIFHQKKQAQNIPSICFINPGNGHAACSLMNNVNLFLCLNIACQDREGNLDEFMKTKLSLLHYRGGGIRFGVKSDLLT